jgi:uncharacterized protein (UPF0332 family)
MSLHADLLAHARYLVRREPKRPKQVTLRRAISAAYYALFHLLIFEASRLFAKDVRLWKRLNRVYGHGEMYEVSVSFAHGRWPKVFDPIKGVFLVPQELKDVAQAFLDLQEARHDADYDLNQRFTRSDAVVLVKRADQAFRDWKAVRRHDLARIYVGCFLSWKLWDKAR